VRTYHVDMNITLAVDERLIRRARRSAAAMGKSVNQLVREFLESLTEQGSAEDFERELRQLSARAGGKRRGWRFNRDEAHGRT
jgi:hypothetical protein